MPSWGPDLVNKLISFHFIHVHPPLVKTQTEHRFIANRLKTSTETNGPMCTKLSPSSPHWWTYIVGTPKLDLLWDPNSNYMYMSTSNNVQRTLLPLQRPRGPNSGEWVVYTYIIHAKLISTLTYIYTLCNTKY
jgi:hypothetical protein